MLKMIFPTVQDVLTKWHQIKDDDHDLYVMRMRIHVCVFRKILTFSLCHFVFSDDYRFLGFQHNSREEDDDIDQLQSEDVLQLLWESGHGRAVSGLPLVIIIKKNNNYWSILLIPKTID